MLANLQLSSETFLRIEVANNRVELCRMYHDKDSSDFDQLAWIDIPKEQIEAFIILLTQANKELNE